MRKEEAYEKIKQLVHRFSEHIDEYKRTGYSEVQTRVDYINPFFKALGWDMDNEQGFSEAYREVIHEDKVKISGSTKAPDYGFTLFGQRKFFVDAKKPSVNIKGDPAPSYQIRRYGWSAKVPVSIVTDFEEFAIYDCRKKPKPTDHPSVSRIKYLTYNQYLREFDFIWDIFAKENLPKGRFDKYVQSDTSKKGTATVDEEFLKSIENWRTYLATNVALRNKELPEDELNYAVQKLIDRIIFLRMCEDRNIEPYGELRKAAEGTNVCLKLFRLFHHADERYNSGLFDFKEDCVTPFLVIDDKVLKLIIRDLYYPDCEYEFSVMPADILGSVYERFLGKTIRLTKAHLAKIEEKPEVRKAGGVYYTPKYVVDYIVQNTVGKLVEGKTPVQVAKLRICDPACGSGSFLIGAYQYLLDWHLQYYSRKSPSGKKSCPLTPDGNLTTAEKKRILLNNIYGVDIDAQAVEVTRLNLLLKSLEGETQASINQQLKLFHERVLPNLSRNIKCGNSLIGPDFYDNQLDLFPENLKKINAFDWKQGFPEVFKQGGFDAIIGNPPYVMLQTLETKGIFKYALQKYQSAIYKIDTYQLFLELSVTLIKINGFLGFITSSSYLKNIHSEPLRKFLLENTAIKKIMLFQYPVFSGASVDVSIGIFQKSSPVPQNNEIEFIRCTTLFELEQIRKINQKEFWRNNRLVYNISISSSENNIINKVKKRSMPLGKFCNAYFGIQTHDRNKYVSEIKINDDYQPVIDGGNINRYSLKKPSEYVNFTQEAIKSGGSEIVYRETRIGIRQIGQVPIATIIPKDVFALNTLYNVYINKPTEYSLNFLLAIINSRITQFIWKKIHFDEKKTFPKIKKEAILSIDIPEIDFSLSKRIVELVDKLLSLNEHARIKTLDTFRQQVQRSIDHFEKEIDGLVYRLYGLSEEEIKIVEGKS